MENITNCFGKYGWIINLAFLGGYAAQIQKERKPLQCWSINKPVFDVMQ